MKRNNRAWRMDRGMAMKIREERDRGGGPVMHEVVPHVSDDARQARFMAMADRYGGGLDKAERGEEAD